MMNLSHLPGLTAQHVESMAAVAEGADVISYGIAKDLRDVQRLHPTLISIGPCQHRYRGEQRPPRSSSFGAILTDAGRAALAQVWGPA